MRKCCVFPRNQVMESAQWRDVSATELQRLSPRLVCAFPLTIALHRVARTAVVISTIPRRVFILNRSFRRVLMLRSIHLQYYLWGLPYPDVHLMYYRFGHVQWSLRSIPWKVAPRRYRYVCRYRCRIASGCLLRMCSTVAVFILNEPDE